MTSHDVQIYGAGLSGLVSAIHLARNGFHVSVYEKEEKIGGSIACHPSIHMTPMHLQRMEEYIGIELYSCFSPLREFRGYIGPQKYAFSTEALYLVERGPRPSSLDYYLYTTALNEGVGFEFSHPITSQELRRIPDHSIIATAGYSQIIEALHLPYVVFKQFDTHLFTNLEDICIVYFGDFTSDYGYISTKNGLLSAQLSGRSNLSKEKVQRFADLVKETEGIDLDGWSSVISYFPKKGRLFTTIAGKTLVLAGDTAGFIDPFFGFGVSGALMSGKIAAMGITSKQKALQEFAQFNPRLNKDLLLHTLYRHLPFKKFILSQAMKFQDTPLSFLKRSIPGFVNED
jgi:flavin-dependent dehydrogenase